MNAAWLHGTVAYFDWILGDTPISPLSDQQSALIRLSHSPAQNRHTTKRT